MKEKALEYYRDGYNCSQCMLKAAGDAYKISITEEMIKLLEGVSVGFGVGSMCSVLAGAIMTFGLVLDEGATKRARIKLLDLFAQNHSGNICCPALKNSMTAGGCEELVYEIAGIAELIIKEELC